MRHLAALLTALVLLLAWSPAASAQAPSVRAEVDRQRLSTDDQLLLTVVVQGEFQSISPPTLPAFEGFDLLGTSYRSESRIVGGQRSFEARYLYQLRPTQLGPLRLPSIELIIDGQAYQTEPIDVEVGEGSLPTPLPAATGSPGRSDAPARDLWVEASVVPPEPYVGQAFSYVFQFLQTYRLGLRPSYEAPSFRGLLSESPAQRVLQTQRGGRAVRVIELSHLLFAPRAGSFEIEPARFTIPGSIGRGPLEFETDPVTVRVRPLPEGAPEGFAGAVGRFELSVELDEDARAEVGAPLRLLVRIRGEGNITGLPEPEWPELPPGWQTFEGDQASQTELDEGVLRGARVYERFIVPAAPGPVTLPPMRYVYFDPADERYHVVTSQPIELEVAASAAAESPSPASVPALLEPGPGLAAGDAGRRGSLLLLLALLPPLLLLADRGLQRQRQAAARRRAAEAERPLAQALAILERAGQGRSARASEPEGARQAESALRRYLSLKLPAHESRLTRAEIASGLAAAGLPEPLRLETLSVWDAMNARFAPAAARQSTTVSHSTDALRELLRTLDATWPGTP